MKNKVQAVMSTGEAATIIQMDDKGVLKMPVKAGVTVVDLIAKQEIEVKRLAAEIIEGTVKVGEKYLSLCAFIRDNQVAKANATKWLLDMGFSKPRASEVVKVSSASAKVWSEFAAKSIGWRGALQLTRGNIEEMKRVNPAIVPPELEKEAHAELVREEEESMVEKAEKYAHLPEAERNKKIEEDLNAGKRVGADKAAIKILKLAASVGFGKKKVWTIPNNRYVLTLTFNRKAKVEVPREESK